MAHEVEDSLAKAIDRLEQEHEEAVAELEQLLVDAADMLDQHGLLPMLPDVRQWIECHRAGDRERVAQAQKAALNDVDEARRALREAEDRARHLGAIR